MFDSHVQKKNLSPPPPKKALVFVEPAPGVYKRPGAALFTCNHGRGDMWSDSMLASPSDQLRMSVLDTDGLPSHGSTLIDSYFKEFLKVRRGALCTTLDSST